MSELLKRLLRLTRVHVHDLLTLHRSGDPELRGDANDGRQENPAGAPHISTSSFETSPSNDLPYSEELAGYYRTLDLPFGTPLEQVTKRWKTYLKTCHPDRFTYAPEKLSDATRVTQELTTAYEKIKHAWEQH